MPPPSVPKPFWTKGRQCLEYKCHDGGVVRYMATLVAPSDYDASGATTQVFPMVVYFTGLGGPGGFKDLAMDRFGKAAPSPFVFVAPLRPPGRWWVLDNDKEPWGFIDGDFRLEDVDNFLEWIGYLTDDHTVDKEFVSLIGFSAGAYAVSEIIARNRSFNLHGVLMGGLHGHSQSNMDDVHGKRSAREDIVKAKWEAYLGRLRMLVRPPRLLIGVHHPGDETCPWVHAEKIYCVLDAQLRCRGERPLEIDLVTGMAKSKKNKTLHNYHDAVVYRPAYLRRLVPNHDGSTPFWLESDAEVIFRPHRLQGCDDGHRGPEGEAALQKPARIGRFSRTPATPSCAMAVASPPPAPRRSRAVKSESPARRAPQSLHSKEEELLRRREDVLNVSRQFTAGPAKRWGAPRERSPLSRERSPLPRSPRSRSPLRRRCIRTPPRRARSRSPRRPSRSPSVKWEAKSEPAEDSPAPCNAGSPADNLASEEEAAPLPQDPVAAARFADRSRLMCAAPNCWFLVHEDPAFGGFCCRKCHWRWENNSKCKKKHGQLCQGRLAPDDAPRAAPIPPDQPMSL